jgi:hypothetical protein
MVVIAKIKLNEKMASDKQNVARKVRVERKLTFANLGNLKYIMVE